MSNPTAEPKPATILEPTFDLVRFIISVSEALELASEQLAHHQRRTARIVLSIGKFLGFSSERIRTMFFAAVLHDIGALSPEEKMVLHSGSPTFIDRHTRVGERIINRIPFLEDSARLVRLHHSSWCEVNDTTDPDTALDSGIIAIADTVERLIDREEFILHQDGRITKAVLSEESGVFPQAALDAFSVLAQHESFWLDLEYSRTISVIERVLPFGKFEVPRRSLLDVSAFVKDIIDFRTRFTATHSSGVAAASRTIGKAMGFSEANLRDLEVAGNIHDIGKMSVGDGILLKPGPLDAREAAVMRKHSYLSYQFARSSGVGHEIASWAGFHHERLNGSGYPFHHDGDEISLGSRIVAVADVVTALAEDRPYRAGMQRSTALATVKNMAAADILDPVVVQALEDDYVNIVRSAMDAQRTALERFEGEIQPGEA